MTSKDYLFRIADLIGSNLAFDFFDWKKLQEEIGHLDYLDDHTIDMIQANVVQAASIRTEIGLVIDDVPEHEIMLEIANYLGLLTMKPVPEECIGSRDIIERAFSTKQMDWGKDFHLLLTIIGSGPKLLTRRKKDDKIERKKGEEKSGINQDEMSALRKRRSEKKWERQIREAKIYM